MNKQNLKRLFLSTLLFLFFTTISAQQKNLSISGIVTEAGTGEVLIGANVILYTDSLRTSEPVRGSATTKYGFYSIPDIDPGIYYIFASSIGYETVNKKAVITPASGSVKLNFELNKIAIPLSEVVISERKTEFTPTPGTIEINPAMVQKLPSIGGEADIFRALQLLPGVTAATEISPGIYVRGSSSSDNLTLIDGVVVYNPSHLGDFASTFNSDAIRNIKLIKGAFPAQYGGRLASILDITLREGSKERLMGSVGLNSISSRLTVEGPLDTNVTCILSGRIMYLDKILPLITKFDQIPRYGFYDFNGKINFRISEKDRVFISGFLSSDKINEAPGSSDIGFSINWSNSTVNLTWTSISSPAVFNSTSLMYTNYKFRTLIEDKIPIKNPLDFYTSCVVDDILFKKEIQYFFSKEHSFKAGAEGILHFFNTTTSDYYIVELDYIPSFATKLTVPEGSVYLEDDFSPSDDFKINMGLRLYYFPDNNFWGVEPRISAIYFLFDRLIIRGSFAVAHQALHMLSRSDVYLPTDMWFPSTKNISPSRSIQGSVGFEATSMDRTFLFSFEGYYKDLSNLYEYKESANFDINTSFENNLTIGKGEAYGVELFLNKRLGNFSGWLGYTLAWTRRYFDLLNAGKPFFPRHDRRHDISAVINYDLNENFSLNMTWTYGTGQAYSLPVGHYSIPVLNTPRIGQLYIVYDYSLRDQFRLPPFHKLDFSCSYKFKLSSLEWELSLNVYNVYNRYNPFSKYIGYRLDENGEKIPLLKQFTLFPFLPTAGINVKF